MIKKKFTAVLLSAFMTISTLAYCQTTVKATSINGWQKNGTTWYYYVNGSKATNWIQANGKWYYLKTDGAMATGWILTNGKWYYLNPNGDMVTGWSLINGKWYYLNPNGAMATGWIDYNGKSYYLNTNGDMAVNTTTTDGYVVGADGAWNGQAKHNNNALYNFDMKDNNGKTYTVKIFSYDNVVTKASYNPSEDWANVWAGASEGEKLSKGRYKISVSKYGESNSELYEIYNNEEITLNLDRDLIRVHKNVQSGQPDFLIMGSPTCSNASEMKVYYIKDGKLKLSNFIDNGKTSDYVYTFNSENLFFNQKENNIFETSSYSNSENYGFYIHSHKFNLDRGEFTYIDTKFMNNDDYFKYVDQVGTALPDNTAPIVNDGESEIKVNSIYTDSNGKKYVKCYLFKCVTDVNEAIEYEKKTGQKVPSLFYDEYGNPGLYDDYFDMPLSDEFSMPVDGNAAFYCLFVNPNWSIPEKVDFSNINKGIYKIVVQNKKIVRMDQEYRP